MRRVLLDRTYSTDVDYAGLGALRRLAIAAQFGEKEVQMRWLAAPVIRKRVTDGILAFTPDASREETELIVRGLNNVAVKLGNQPKKKKSAKAASP